MSVKFVGQAFCLIGNPKWKGEPSLQVFNENRSVLVNWTGIIYNAKGGHGRDCTDNFRQGFMKQSQLKVAPIVLICAVSKNKAD